MQILIACDKFKGCLTAKEVSESLSKGLQQVDSTHCIKTQILADGGDGSLLVLKDTLELDHEECQTVDPLFRPIKTSYLKNEHQAFIELANASGIHRLSHDEKNPMLSSTYGTGLLIQDALSKGCREINLFLGGSCTNDMGIGILEGLGFAFYTNRRALTKVSAKDLKSIDEIVFPELDLDDLHVKILCDVSNPLYGKNGAAYVYGPQKGANPQMVEDLDFGLRQFSRLLEKEYGCQCHFPGAGAAGGIAAGLQVLSPQILGGFDFISELVKLQDQIKKADIIITGEGYLDNQSLSGKVIDGVSKLCHRHNKKLIAVCGDSSLSLKNATDMNIQKTYKVIDLANSIQDSMTHADHYLIQIGEKIAKELKNKNGVS